MKLYTIKNITTGLFRVDSSNRHSYNKWGPLENAQFYRSESHARGVVTTLKKEIIFSGNFAICCYELRQFCEVSVN